MDIEKWVSIPTHPRYEISNQGRVRATSDRLNPKNRNAIVRPFVGAKGYLRVMLYVGGQKYKQRKIHRLVAECFISGQAPGLQVNHKDGNKRNNSALNLEWVTAHENIAHAFANRLMRPWGHLPS